MCDNSANTVAVTSAASKWGTPKQWGGWIVFCGVIPTVVYLAFARYVQQHELVFYLVGTPSLLLYFFILGWLGLDVPGKVTEASPENQIPVRGVKLIVKKAAGEVVIWLRTIAVFLGFPLLGIGMIYYAVRDGEVVGYCLGPATIWVSGGMWALTVQFYIRKRKERRQATSLQ